MGWWQTGRSGWVILPLRSQGFHGTSGTVSGKAHADVMFATSAAPENPSILCLGSHVTPLAELRRRTCFPCFPFLLPAQKTQTHKLPGSGGGVGELRLRSWPLFPLGAPSGAGLSSPQTHVPCTWELFYPQVRNHSCPSLPRSPRMRTNSRPF